MTSRRIRIVCISDTHNQTPRLPAGDILIHAGDLTNQGSYSELQKTIEWIRQAKFQVKIIVCGNHDISCDEAFYREYGGFFHNKKTEDPQRCIDLFSADPSIVYLNHELKQVAVRHADGSSSRLNIFGSPYSPAHGFWAFGYPPDTAAQLWDQIPLHSDIVVTHTPAKFHRDECGKRGTAGCEVLRQALWRVRPRLAVCGHIHEAYGVEVVQWDLSSPNIKYKELGTRDCTDPDPCSKKQFLVDLSARARSLALKNDGAIGDLVALALPLNVGAWADRSAVSGHTDVHSYEDTSEEDMETADEQDQLSSRRTIATDLLPEVPPPATLPFPDYQKAKRPTSHTVDTEKAQHPATHGQGGPASSPRSDHEAISGRDGRMETCIVNAAFMASNFPHMGGKRFHKPIVIDLDFPAVDQHDQSIGQSDD